jgi:hypothetical protein
VLSAEITGGIARLSWHVALNESAFLTVFRSSGSDAWQELESVIPDGSGCVIYEDVGLAAGTRYGYRLGLRTAVGAETSAGEVWLDTPLPPDLAVHVPSPVVGGNVQVSFFAHVGRSVGVELLDAGGRVVASRIAEPGQGRRRLDLAHSKDLAPGIYLVRVDFDRPVVTKVAVIR